MKISVRFTPPFLPLRDSPPPLAGSFALRFLHGAARPQVLRAFHHDARAGIETVDDRGARLDIHERHGALGDLAVGADDVHEAVLGPGLHGLGGNHRRVAKRARRDLDVHVHAGPELRLRVGEFRLHLDGAAVGSTVLSTNVTMPLKGGTVASFTLATTEPSPAASAVCSAGSSFSGIVNETAMGRSA
jgi:hypothetical protein